MDNSASKHSSDVSKAKKALNQAEKRIAELDRLFARLYEDNVSGKISDERFAVLSTRYEDEQKKLKEKVSELFPFIETAEQKCADVNSFIKVVQKYGYTCDEIEEMLSDHDLLHEALRDVKYMCGENLYEECYGGYC